MNFNPDHYYENDIHLWFEFGTETNNNVNACKLMEKEFLNKR